MIPQSKNSTGKRSRQRRQFINDIPYQFPANCFTSTGSYGICLPFQQCYPYMKIPALIHYQNLLTRMQDACTYLTTAGTQDIGICCQNVQFTDPMGGAGQYPIYPPFYPENPESPESPEETPSNEIPEDPYQPADWPPPLPTHPPEHETAPTHPPSTSQHWPPTQPTRPTYPPGPGRPPPPTPIYPPGVKPTTKPPYKPPTTRPPYKPPVTQRPPWTRPTTKPTTQYPTTDADAEDVNVSECGIKNGNQDQERIVGGHDADPGEWPWMAAIMTNGRLFCGGSLIDNTHVLTAAHCVAHMNPWDVARMRVNLGDHNIKSKGDGEHIERRVKKVVRHRGFDPQTLYNDIAVITLDPPVKFTKTVRPICLPAGKAAYSGKMGTVIGWGSLREMGPTPSILQEVNIPIWTNQACRNKYGPAAPGGIVDSFLCAGKAEKDSCSGDSGGPLMINDGKWKQVGIVSWGIGCGKGQFPGVYTRMTSYMTWLNKNLQI
ncbi:hypothetical protein V9T40_011593 [Parthenolecanium corni]|uniref:Phenoloxidase-activating factor 2 n=1 Tax=Parthenolecanium corni TaxID=536013 RepID=A0AAN9TJ07_9HEMI